MSADLHQVATLLELAEHMPATLRKQTPPAPAILKIHIHL
jgi:hypothetical protein